MLSPTLPAHQKQEKGSTLAAQGRQGGTDTLWTRVGFCVTMGQKQRNVASRSFFQGIDEALSAIKLLQHGLTHPLYPPHPSPRVWLGDWVLVRMVSDEAEDEGLRLWGTK